MFTHAFWTATLERVLRTFAQSLIAILTASGLDVINADWKGSLAAATMAALLALLTAVAAGSGGGPGLVETPNANIVAQVGSAEAPVVAGPASPIPNGTPVTVAAEPTTVTPLPPTQ